MRSQEDRRKDEQTRERVDIILECFEPKYRMYWINALVKQGKLSTSRAGQLITKGNY